MSEEILKALMELFALIVKQDGGILQDERDYVLNFLDKQLNTNTLIKYILLFDELTGSPKEVNDIPETNSPSVRDSVKILNICKQINKTLNKSQKVVVLIHLFELINASKRYTPQRINIITIVSEVFRILPADFSAIEQFVRNDNPDTFQNPGIIVLKPGMKACEICHKKHDGNPDTTIKFLRIASVDLYFVKYLSTDQMYLNGLPLVSGQVYSFAKGSALRSHYGHAFYYSDISSRFLSTVNTKKLSFTAKNISYRLPDRQKILATLSFSAVQGNLIGILGPSGSGKTTLLNVISGITEPATGSVKLNGLDVFRDKKKLEGVFGFIPQDDLLIEDLTVFENLYYASCQCLGDKPREEIVHLVEQMLASIGLAEKSDLKVGNSLNKIISGGQRKRLNIALELIREPSVLFIDEPTSGLSSKDSENLIVLLRDLTLKGKLIFTVIHQPSSDIFKMFDKVIILDQGGYMVYYGNPVDSIIYFKTLDSQINASQGECPSCGNVNPEIIFKILENQVVDEFGNYTEKRKVKPKEWSEKFKSEQSGIVIEEVTEAPEKNLHRPSRLKQFTLFLSRDLRSKISNLQYVILTILEAPVLAFILSYIIRYIPDPGSKVYCFAENENIPVYIFMSIIVALFLGLTISAVEIFHDRKILKREQFLNLSRGSYLMAKVALLVLISVLQSFLFVAVANQVLEIKGMFFHYWIAVFTTALCANMIGLNISSSFNSVITIYIIIPLLIIPMMVLSGAMFSFDKLNRNITRVDKVPLIAEIMPTRWTYEALMVSQFKDNRYSSLLIDGKKETYYSVRKKISEADFNTAYRIPEWNKVIAKAVSELMTPSDKIPVSTLRSDIGSKLRLVRNELKKIENAPGIPEFKHSESLYTGFFTPAAGDSLLSWLRRADSIFTATANRENDLKDQFFRMNSATVRRLEKKYYNYKLEEIVTKYYEPEKILISGDSFIQNTDPVYLDPVKKGLFGFRTHFFAPSKYFFGIKTDTFAFNILFVIMTSVLLYIALYYDLLSRLISFTRRLIIRK
jgi:ABC transport system ATP-binding/permease protein